MHIFKKGCEHFEKNEQSEPLCSWMPYGKLEVVLMIDFIMEFLNLLIQVGLLVAAYLTIKKLDKQDPKNETK